MNNGKACGIFKNINNTTATDSEKIEAINDVVAMETHNAITKDACLKALDWLSRYCFFLELKASIKPGDDIDERLMKIADNYGLNSQLDILQEECAELVQAVSKYRRGGSNLLVLEELADVEIMTAQIRYLSGKNSTIIDDYKEKKIRRQLQRMEGEGNG